MKKLLSIAAAAFIVILTACSSGPKISAEKANEINNKIENDETLSQEDYSFMLDYIEEADEKGTEMNVNELMDKYPYTITFGYYLGAASELGLLEGENQARVDKILEEAE